MKSKTQATSYVDLIRYDQKMPPKERKKKVTRKNTEKISSNIKPNNQTTLNKFFATPQKEAIQSQADGEQNSNTRQTLFQNSEEEKQVPSSNEVHNDMDTKEDSDVIASNENVISHTIRESNSQGKELNAEQEEGEEVVSESPIKTRSEKSLEEELFRPYAAVQVTPINKIRLAADKGMQMIRQSIEEQAAYEKEKQERERITEEILLNEEKRKKRFSDNSFFDDSGKGREKMIMTDFQKQMRSRTCFKLQPIPKHKFNTQIDNKIRTHIRRCPCRIPGDLASYYSTNAAQILVQVIAYFLNNSSIEDRDAYSEATEYVSKIMQDDAYILDSLDVSSLFEILADLGVTETVTSYDEVLTEEQKLIISRNLSNVTRILTILVKRKGFYTDDQLLQLLRLSVLMSCSEEVNSYIPMSQEYLLHSVCEELSARTASNQLLLSQMTKAIVEVLQDGLYKIELISKQGTSTKFTHMHYSVSRFLTNTMGTLRSHLPNTFNRIWRVINIHMIAILLNIDELKFESLQSVAFTHSNIAPEHLTPQWIGTVRISSVIVDDGSLDNEDKIIVQALTSIIDLVKKTSKAATPSSESVFANMKVSTQAMDLFAKTFCADTIEANQKWHDIIIVGGKNVLKPESGPKKRSRGAEKMNLVQHVREMCDDLNMLISDPRRFAQQANLVMALTSIMTNTCVLLKKINDRKVSQQIEVIEKKKKQRKLTDGMLQAPLNPASYEVGSNCLSGDYNGYVISTRSLDSNKIVDMAEQDDVKNGSIPCMDLCHLSLLNVD